MITSGARVNRRSDRTHQHAQEVSREPIMDETPEWLIPVLLVATAPLTLWTAGAIYYDVCRGAKWGRWVAWCWIVGVVALFVAWQPLWQPVAALFGFAALFVVWWRTLKPSHDREWEPAVAVLPRA